VPKVEVGSGTVRVTPLWARVDANRAKIAWFVTLFVTGSAILLDAALIVLPGWLLSLAFADDPEQWFARLWLVAGIALGVLLALGALLSAVQLANAQDWVRNRFKGRDLKPDEAPVLESAVADMVAAAGLAKKPKIVVLEAPGESINAAVVGTKKGGALVAVTPGFVKGLTQDEQRAVVAVLTARVISGDVLYATALAALMGPLKAIRESAALPLGAGMAVTDGCADPGCTDGCANGCSSDGCSGCGDIGDLDDAGPFIGLVLFLVFVAMVTYAAVVSAAWIVTLWGRALHHTSYEKADAEGLLLLKDAVPMMSALRKAVTSSNAITEGDSSYDAIFYTGTSGTPRVDRVEKRRYERLRQVAGTEGLAAPPLA
jgi:Zn-dependent protease with chaperone function